jgi:hypothetical protein
MRSAAIRDGVDVQAPAPWRVMEHARAAASLLAAALPLLERSYQVLPVTQRIREDVLPAAMLATLLCIIAGYATSRHSLRGLQVGWTSLVLFMAVIVAMFGFMDLIPRGDRALYIDCFAFFGLSAASVLSIRQEEPVAPATHW